ncbi:MAG: mtnN, partial [Dehalococcoidia bacterium]|nr:mtnN [Dehalococcoidia bacterium]
MLVFMSALGGELHHVERLLKRREFVNIGGFSALSGEIHGVDVLLVRSGMGRLRVCEATEAVLLKYRPGAIFSLGYAGSVTPTLRRGDLVLAKSVCKID